MKMQRRDLFVARKRSDCRKGMSNLVTFLVLITLSQLGFDLVRARVKLFVSSSSMHYIALQVLLDLHLFSLSHYVLCF